MTRRIVLTVLAFLLSGLHTPSSLQAGEQIAFDQAQIEALGIELALPSPADSAAGPTYPARVALPPSQERVITAGEGGVIESVLTSEGQWVEADAPLLRLKSAGLADLQRQYLQALEQLELAKQQLGRDEALFRDGIVPERRVQESRAAEAQARTLTMGARRALEASGLGAGEIDQLAHSKQVSSTQILSAPFAGTVLEVMVRAGERVEPTAALLRLGQTDTLWLEIRIPVEAVHGISPGTRVGVADPAAQGRVIFVGQRVDPADQSIVVRAQIDQGAGTLRPGQLVKVSLMQTGGEQALRVPLEAVVRRREGQYVFVRTGDGFRVEPVQVISAGDVYCVVSGALTPQDQVAVRGVAAIKGAWMGIGGE